MDTETRKRMASVSILFFLFLLLSACGAKATVAPSPTPISLPSPTPVLTPFGQLTTIPLPVIPTSTPSCVAGLTFISDLTIPDDAIVAAGRTLDKKWLVQNSGSCNWDERYRMRLISGDLLGVPAEQSLYPARAGTQAILQLVFTAPTEAGEYISEWQAFDFNGIPFGDTFYMKIIVQ